MKKRIFVIFLAVTLISTTVFGAEQIDLTISSTEEQQQIQVPVDTTNYAIEAVNQIKRPDQSIYSHPGNMAEILGVGEGNHIIMKYKGNETIDIALEGPLYRISPVYADRIIKKDGIWGVEREIGKILFDGSEDWKLEDDYRMANNKSTLFSLDPDVKIKLNDGMSTHFQVIDGIHKSAITAEGITMMPEKWYARVSNVRNIKSVEVWQKYLADQASNNTPVTLFYILPEAQFEPLEKAIQTKLDSLDRSEIRYTEGVQPKIVELNPQGVYHPFLSSNTWRNDENLKKTVDMIKDIKIYNATADDLFVLSRFQVNDLGECIIEIGKVDTEDEKKAVTTVCSAKFSLLDMNMTADKLTEIALEPVEPSSISASVFINFSRFKMPIASYKDMTYEEAGLVPNILMKKEMVLPINIPVVEGSEYRIYFNNTVMNGDISKFDKVIAQEGHKEVTIEEKYLKVLPDKDSATWRQNLTLTAASDTLPDVSKASTKFITVPKDAGKGLTKTILFLGDSIIGQDYYTQSVAELFEEDEMDVELIGTKGSEGVFHEGRGGWSSYDYCNEEIRYGEKNPFLKDGKFDFSYYMEQNKFEKVDMVVLNLGINDLNQPGHNSHEEIISNFNKIIKSIQKFNPDAKILIGLPTMPFAKDATVSAKNTRLNFIKTLNDSFGKSEEEGLFLIPLYVNIDPFTDYKFEASNPNGSLDVTDTSHPAISGYQRLAEGSFNLIKYVQWLEESSKAQ